MKWLLWASLLAFGCTSTAPVVSASDSPKSPGPALAARSQVPLMATRAGQEDFRLQPEGGSMQVVCQGKTYQAKIESDRVKVLDGEVLQAKAKRKEAGFELEDGSGERLIRAKYKQGPDIRFEDGQERILLHLQPQADRLRWLGPAGQSLGEIRQQADEIQLMDATKKVTAAVKGASRLEVGAILPLDSLTPLQRATLALYLAEVGP
jgi:hypothetical protein